MNQGGPASLIEETTPLGFRADGFFALCEYQTQSHGGSWKDSGGRG